MVALTTPQPSRVRRHPTADFWIVGDSTATAQQSTPTEIGDGTYATSTDRWTFGAGDLDNIDVGSRVKFTAVGTGAEGYVAERLYWVVAKPTSTTIQLSRRAYGDVLVGGSNSSGTWTLSTYGRNQGHGMAQSGVGFTPESLSGFYFGDGTANDYQQVTQPKAVGFVSAWDIDATDFSRYAFADNWMALHVGVDNVWWIGCPAIPDFGSHGEVTQGEADALNASVEAAIGRSLDDSGAVLRYVSIADGTSNDDTHPNLIAADRIFYRLIRLIGSPTHARVRGSVTHLVRGGHGDKTLHVPASVVLVTTITAPTVTATAEPSPAQVQGTTTIGTPTVTAGADPSPAQVQGSTTITTPTGTATAEPSPAQVQGTTTIGGPQVTATATATPGQVIGTTTIPPPTVTATAEPSPAQVAGTTTIGGLTVTATAETGPGQVLATVTVTASASGTGSATVAPAQVQGAATIGGLTVTATAEAGPGQVATTTVITTPTGIASVEQAAAQVQGATTITAPTGTATAEPGPAQVVGATTIGATASGGAAGTATPAQVVGSTTIGALTVTATALAGPGQVLATTTIGAPTVTATALAGPAQVVGAVAITATGTGGAAEVQPAQLLGTTTITAPTLYLVQNVGLASDLEVHVTSQMQLHVTSAVELHVTSESVAGG